MASVWISPRKVKSGIRFHVIYRLGGRESKQQHGGAFKTWGEAETRREWIAEEIAAMRNPDIKQFTGLNITKPKPPAPRLPFVMCPKCDNTRMVPKDHFWRCVGCGYVKEFAEDHAQPVS